jgi:5-methylcytosine-specific restriction endonuclease McrA
MAATKKKLEPFEAISLMSADNSCLGQAELAWVLSLGSIIPEMPIPYKKMGLNRKALLAWVKANEAYLKALTDESQRLVRRKDYMQRRHEFTRLFKEKHPLQYALIIVTEENAVYERERYYAQVRSGRYEELGAYTQEDIDLIFRKQKGRCRYFRYCGHSFADHEYTIDHRIAVTLGGLSKPSNLQLLCRSCNSIKKNDYIKSFERRLKQYYTKPNEVSKTS